MWDRFVSWQERRRAQTLVDSLVSWHETCENVTVICSRALNDPSTLEGDIGEVLDQADRKLFHFRNQMTEARRELKRGEPNLAMRLKQVTDDVYNLRNQTARFLIRAQGPHPFATGRPANETERNAYYYKALEEVGYKGRDLANRLHQDADELWDDLQTALNRAHQSLQT